MSRSILTFVKSAVGALVLCAFTSTSFAAVDMFLEIKDLKGKVVSRCEVSKDGSFSCPALPAGEYTASVSWSWGVSNQGTHSSSSSARKDGGTRHATDVNFAPVKLSLSYNVRSPRDAASGQATGKRTHKPITISTPIDQSSSSMKKELSKSSPKLELGTIKIDEDCDGLEGSVYGHGTGGKMSIESWSWGESNAGSSR